ncbi:hypothetical protein BH23GEM3_BH23GEM3_17300 [soil metagenome]
MCLPKTVLLLMALATGATNTLSAQSVTAFKNGEQTTGMTKQCFYNALGNGHTRTISSTALCPMSIQVQFSPGRPPTPPSPQPTQPGTVTAFKTGERTTGMTRQCFYDALGNSHTRTISSTALCPMSIQVKLGGS